MAAAEGINYEVRVGAWSYVQLLAAGSVRRFGANEDWRVSAVWMQAPIAVGDVVVEHNGNGAIYIQAKYRKKPFSFNDHATGDFVAVLRSFARQYFSAVGPAENAANPWSRPFDAARDVLALVMPSVAAGAAGRRVAHVLSRLGDPAVWENRRDVFNAEELKTFDLLVTLGDQVLSSSTSAAISPDDVRRFLSAVQVIMLDLNDADAGAAEVQRTLAESVLPSVESKNAPSAWRALIGIGEESNRLGHRLDMASLSKRLFRVGVSLRTPVTFRDDIAHLKEITKRNLKRLRQLSELRVAEPPLEIPRECVPALGGAIETNRVIIGDPGAGKSGVLYQLCNRLAAQAKDFVLLLADDLENESSRPLNEVLHIKNDLVDVLAAWMGASNAYLIVDALDAARDPKLARKLRSAMTDVAAAGTRWRIVASIRRFDLKHSPDTQILFAGEPTPEYADPDFNGIAHFKVPAFSESELKIAEAKHPQIAQLMRKARRDSTTLALLTEPFNLSLACELIRAGVAVDDIVPLTTNVALLDKFWSHRVTAGGAAGALRVAALTKLVEHLVTTLSMGVRNDPCIYDATLVFELAELHILEPGAYDGGSLRFSHHLLHDYAVARLLLRPMDKEELAQQLVSRPELAIYARQSLLLHFDFLWDSDASRDPFWQTATELVIPALPLIARIIATECAVQRVRTPKDFSPLITLRLRGKDSDASDVLLKYIVSEYLDVTAEDHLADSAVAWSQLALDLIRQLPECFWQVHLLLHKLSDVPSLDPASRRLINQAGRLLAKNRLSLPRPDERFGPAFITAVKTICRTAAEFPSESEKTLRPLLIAETAAKFGDRFFWQLASETKYLVRVSPPLVADLHVAVFGNKSTAEGTEQIGGRIMPMTISRRDNYNLAEHQLKECFPAFFSTAPIDATRAVIEFLPGFRQANHPSSSGKPDRRQPFTFWGHRCHLIEDLSCIWASDSPHHGDDALVILRHTCDGWAKLAKNPKVIDPILDLVAKQNQLAIIWWNLLEAGAKVPKTLGLKLAELLEARPILMGMDTHYSAAKLLQAIFPLLSLTRRRRIENAILQLPQEKHGVAAGKRTTEDSIRGRYLACIKPGQLVTTEAKALFAALKKIEGLRPNTKPFVSHSFTGSSDWSDYVPELKKEDLKTATHLNARAWEQKLQRHPWNDGVKLSAGAVDEVWPDLEAAHAFAVTRSPADLNPIVGGLIWARVVEVAEAIVRNGYLPKAPERRDYLKAILLRGAKDPKPQEDLKAEAHFAKSPSWGSPSPRIDAAQGLIVWGRESREMTDEIREALRALARDHHPAVRFQISSACNTLYEVDRPLMWELIHERTRAETNAGVWGGWLITLERIAPGHDDEVSTLIFDYLKRFPRGEEKHRDPADTAIHTLGSLFLRFGHTPSEKYIFGLIDDPVENAFFIRQLCQQYRDALAVGLAIDSPDFQKRVHARALAYYLRVVAVAKATLDRLVPALQTVPAAKREPRIEEVRSVLQTLDAVNMQIYFASGAHDGPNARAKGIPPPPPDLFWRDLKPVIEALISAESAHIAYHLAETLEYLVPVDPPAIFGQLVLLVRHANKDGFAHESLAVGVITRIVERYLAEHSDLFITDTACRKGLIEILDTFAAVGWQEARRLIRNLSRIYR